MQPETAIDTWREWNADLRCRPVITGPLGGGRSNRSFLLAAGDVKMVLRINSRDTLLPEAKRSQEAAIWHAASDNGIAPPLLHIDSQNSFLVSAFIDNHLPPEPTRKESVLEQAFGLLERCHGLDVDAPPIDYAAHIEQYWKMIEMRPKLSTPALEDIRQPMYTVVGELFDSGAQMGLCHHDPVVANFVGCPECLYLIDWEYAAHGFVLLDYAALSIEWGVDDSVMVRKTGLDPELLALTKRLYYYLCGLWEAISRN